jgi:hypothetical protein
MTKLKLLLKSLRKKQSDLVDGEDGIYIGLEIAIIEVKKILKEIKEGK